jgi:hypothetical protein
VTEDRVGLARLDFVNASPTERAFSIGNLKLESAQPGVSADFSQQTQIKQNKKPT